MRKGDAEGNGEVVTADSYKHTKTGEFIPSAKLNANLSDEEYRKVKSIAGKNGGYYSRYAKAFLFQDNENGRDKFVEEVNGANNTQYSVSSEAVQRAKEEVEAEIRAAFPNGKVEYVNGVPTITMPNGSKFQYSIRKNIVVNAKEQIPPQLIPMQQKRFSSPNSFERKSANLTLRSESSSVPHLSLFFM